MSSDLPTALEVVQEYFGETEIFKCIEVWTARRNQDRSHLEFSDRTCDTSLFPYQAQGPFKTPIPTPAEIAAARDPSSISEQHRSKNIQVWRVGPYMVKVGAPVVVLQEAENLLYLERNSSVRTPKVYAAFASRDADPFNLKDPELYYNYIVMEYIEGELLSDLFEELKNNTPVKNKIGLQLGEQLRRLRSVPAEDPDHFGRVKGKAYDHLSPFHHPPAPDFQDYGPFNYEELVNRLIHSAKITVALGSNPTREDYSSLNRILFRDARSVLLDHAGPSDRLPVLAHLDAQDHNTIVKLVRNKEGKAVDVEDVVMIDWATMCWMPSWYEAGEICRMMLAPVDFYSALGRRALPVMGHLNMALTTFFAVCVTTGTFEMVHM